MTTTVNWTRTGAFGITPSGYEITRGERAGLDIWHVFAPSGAHVGSYATRDEAVAVAR
jgi:hypothetical protein